MSRIALFRSLNALSLSSAIRFVDRVDALKHRRPKVVVLPFGFLIFLFFYCFMLFYLASYYMARNRFEEYAEVNYVMYQFIRYLTKDQNHSMILLTTVLISGYNFSVTYFTFLQWNNQFVREIATCCDLVRQLSHHCLTLFHTHNRADVNRIIETVAVSVRFTFNKHMTGSERQSLVRLFHRKLEPSYWFFAVLNILTCFVIAFVLTYFLLTTISPEVLFMDTWSNINIVILWPFGILQYLLGVVIPTMAIHLMIMICYGILSSWRQFRSKCRRLDARWSLINQKAKFVILNYKIIKGQRLFMGAFEGFLGLNERIIKDSFFSSVTLMLMANIIMTIELLVSEFNRTLQFWMVSVIGLQIVCFSAILILLIKTIGQLYRLNGFFLHYYVEFAKHHFRFNRQIEAQLPVGWQTKALLRWSLFIEVVHSRRKLAFSMPVFGKITSWKMIQFIPTYTSMLLLVLPMVIEDSQR